MVDNTVFQYYTLNKMNVHRSIFSPPFYAETRQIFGGKDIISAVLTVLQ